MSKNWTEVHDEVLWKSRVAHDYVSSVVRTIMKTHASSQPVPIGSSGGPNWAANGPPRAGRIPDAQTLYQLLRKAKEAGWLPNEEDWANADAGAGYDGGVLSKDDY